MNAKLIPLLIIFLIKFSSAQTQITGLIKDVDTQKTVKYATVYINGTTNGTISNVDGQFRISPVFFPCQLVISHVGYGRKVLDINNSTDLGIVWLIQKTESINEIKVQGLDNREANIMEFKKGFLGVDRWARRANMKNEEVISFSRETSGNDLNDNGKEVTVLIAKSNEPITIDLPLLGYDLHADLVEFRSDDKTESRLGYYYYKPKDDLSRRQKRLAKRKRKDAYNNSSLHFLRALYNDNLYREGYIVVDPLKADLAAGIEAVEVDLAKKLKTVEGTKMLCGLQGTYYGVWYIHKSNGEPVNVAQKKRISFGRRMSFIHFLSDSCIVRENGTTPSCDIVFEGAIARKKVAASLPSDYDEKSKKWD